MRQKQFKRVRAFPGFILMCIVCGLATPALAATFSGTVYLPGADIAPAGGIPVEVTAYDRNTYTSYTTNVTIPETSSSISYSIDNVSGSRIIIEYSYQGSAAYLSTGMYSTSGTVWKHAEAEEFDDSADHTGIDLTLIKSRTISGTISLPSGTASSDINININASDSNWNSFYTNVTIASGASSQIYTVRVPDDAGSSWKVYYYYWGDAYLSEGYYSTSGTTWKEDNATELAGGTDHSGIGLTLLEGKTISGIISLPSGTASSDINININASDSNWNSFYTNVTIASGASSQIYTVRVPDDAGSSRKIYYSYSGDAYLSEGFYSTSGTTWKQDNATELTGGTDHSGIDLTLLEGVTISGTISLPSGTASLDISIAMHAQDSNWNSFYTNVTIASGASSATYTVRVPDDAGSSWKIYYSYWGDAYLSEGYYSTSGTTWSKDNATELAGGTDHSGIDLTLLEGKTISGIISLPSGTASSDINSSIYAQDSNGNSFYTSVTISSGASSATYTLMVPDDSGSSWKVAYGYWYLQDVYYWRGYYTSSGTTWDDTAATLLPGGQDHSGIDLTLIPLKTISGTLNLPSAATSHIVIYIDAWSASSASAYAVGTSYAVFDSGESSTTYTAKVPDDPNGSWIVSYDLSDNENGIEGYWGLGYYGGGTTELHKSDAVQLAGGSDHSNIDMTVISGNLVTGTVSLPGSKKAKNDIVLFVRAEVIGTPVSIPQGYGYGYGYGGNSGTSFDETSVHYQVTIPKNSSSTGYTLTISPEAGINWRVFYSCYQGCEDFGSPGFYNTSKTVADVGQASPLAGGADHNNIDLTLLKRKGMLSFPVRSKDGQISIISM